VTQELGILALIKRGVRVLTASGDNLTDSSDPSLLMMRQITGSFARYEKTRLVAKLRAAREHRRVATGKCEGRKSWAEIPNWCARPSDCADAGELAKVGFVNQRGAEFSVSSIASMLQ
jgi:hypothetical protein